jgi:hypothetical protein
MKKIIRLSESDLTRIVKRVIKEQEQTMAMTPQSYETLKVALGTNAEIFNGSQKVNWVVTPSADKVKDQTGKLVAKPGYLRLDITPEGIPNTRAVLSINCKTKGIEYGGKIISGDYTNITLRYQNRDYKGNDGTQSAKNLLSQALGNRGWLYDGGIKEMGDKYCGRV